MSKRLFIDKHAMGDSELIFAVDASAIEKGYAFGDDMGATYTVPVGKANDIKEFESVGGQIKNEEFLRNHIVFFENDTADCSPAKWFFELLHRNHTFNYDNFEKALEDYNEFEIDADEPKITPEMLQAELEKIASLDPAYYWADLTEYYQYWDGSNQKTIWLSEKSSEWEEVTGEPEYTITETLDSKDHGTGKTKTVRAESGSVYEVYESFYQGDITQRWTKTK